MVVSINTLFFANSYLFYLCFLLQITLLIAFTVKWCHLIGPHCCRFFSN